MILDHRPTGPLDVLRGVGHGDHRTVGTLDGVFPLRRLSLSCAWCGTAMSRTEGGGGVLGLRDQATALRAAFVAEVPESCGEALRLNTVRDVMER